MAEMDLQKKQQFYRFETPGMLGQFIESIDRRSQELYDTHVIDAGQDGVFLSYDQLVTAKVSQDSISNIANYVVEVLPINGEILLKKFPDATTDKTIDIYLQSVRPAPLEGEVTPPDTSEWREVPQAGTLKPVKSKYDEVLLAVMGDPGRTGPDETIQKPERHFKALLTDLSQMDRIDFEYLTLSNDNNGLPFKHLLRVRGLQSFVYIQKWLRQPKQTGVCGVYVPWEAPGVYVSFGYKWGPAPRVISEIVGGKYGGDALLLVTVMDPDPGLDVKQLIRSKDDGHVRERWMIDKCENVGNGKDMELYIFPVIAKAGDWVHGSYADLTKYSIPVKSVMLGSAGTEQIPLDFTMRLEPDRFADVYETRLRQLKRAEKHLREEISVVSSLIERSRQRRQIASLYLYMTQPDDNANEAGNIVTDLDPALRALMLDYPASTMKRLLHIRIDATELIEAAEGPMDVVIDRTLQSEEAGKNVWTGSSMESDEIYRPWALPVEYYPARGMILDLEPEIYRQHRIALFLPTGTVLRPHLQFENLKRNKIVELICGAGGEVTREARANPDAFIFILLQPLDKEALSLITIEKSQFVPLGKRIEYFNKALEGAKEATENLPAPYEDVIEAWAFESAESLYRGELEAATQKAQRYLGVLGEEHKRLIAEAASHEAGCIRLVGEIHAFKAEVEAELQMWRQLAKDLRPQRIETLRHVLDHMGSVRDLFKKLDQKAIDAHEGVSEEHRKQLKDMLAEAEGCFAEIKASLEGIDGCIAKATRR